MSDAADGVDRAARAIGKVNGPEPAKISCFFWQVIHRGGCNLCEMTVDGQREISPELYDGADD
jgi:hypothetical protein